MSPQSTNEKVAQGVSVLSHLGCVLLIGVALATDYWLGLGLHERVWRVRYDAVVIFDRGRYSVKGQVWTRLLPNGELGYDIWREPGKVVYFFRTDEAVVPTGMGPQSAKAGKAYVIKAPRVWREVATFGPSATEEVLHRRFGNKHVTR